MSRHYETMSYAIGMAKERIVWAIKDYVMKAGDEISDYHRTEFGLDEEENEGIKILKVLNIFDNGGCCFPWTEQHQVDNGSSWYTYAFHCLYVVEENGIQGLKCYMLWNEGSEYDENESEPDHDFVDSLPLQVLDKLIAFIGRYDR